MTHHATCADLAAEAYQTAVDAIAATEAADIEWGRAYREATGARSSTAAWRAAYIAALEQDAFDRSSAVGDAYDAGLSYCTLVRRVRGGSSCPLHH